ncbi:hypothetical protein B0H12DRAFT_1238448 [Mycena haematopus]|nr:hypothetical protein B0H12DRAFT_1238448 [Mycena haematopus]
MITSCMHCGTRTTPRPCAVRLADAVIRALRRAVLRTHLLRVASLEAFAARVQAVFTSDGALLQRLAPFADLDTRSLKVMYDSRTPTSAFSVEPFAARFTGLDVHGPPHLQLLHRAVRCARRHSSWMTARFAEVHDLLTKNTERAHSPALETYHARGVQDGARWASLGATGGGAVSRLIDTAPSTCGRTLVKHQR